MAGQEDMMAVGSGETVDLLLIRRDGLGSAEESRYRPRNMSAEIIN